MKSIQMRITTYVFSSLLILFIILLFTIDREMEKNSIPLSKNLTNQIVSARSDQISYWIKQRVEDLEMIAHTVSYYNMNKEEALRYMSSINERKNKWYESFGIVNEKGELWVTNGTKFYINNREYYKKINSGTMDYIISDPIKSKANQQNIIVILYRLNNNEDRYQYVSVALSINKIEEIAADIHLHDGVGKIIDSKGNYIDKVNDQIEKIEKEESDKKIIFQAPIKQVPGWKLIFKVDESKIKEGTRKLQNSALLIGILFSIVLIIILIVFGSSIVKPIRNLQKLMKKVETGDLSVRFEEKRKDEIGQLGKSFNQMLNKLIKIQKEKKKMELRLIQEQIKPHFLYNTLDTIQWMASDYEAEEVVELIEALSMYFRIGLSKGKRFITLGEELDHIESYLKIQKARYEELLQYEIMYDEDIINTYVIRILLQPIVENAICHGIENEKCIIKIDIRKHEENIIMKVKNNGKLIEKNKLNKIQYYLKNHNNPNNNRDDIGFGLYSVNYRLKLTFGEEYGVMLSSKDSWTTAVITCPIINGDEKYVESTYSR